jgi:hypothetical protein
LVGASGVLVFERSHVDRQGCIHGAVVGQAVLKHSGFDNQLVAAADVVAVRGYAQAARKLSGKQRRLPLIQPEDLQFVLIVKIEPDRDVWLAGHTPIPVDGLDNANHLVANHLADVKIAGLAYYVDHVAAAHQFAG